MRISNGFAALRRWMPDWDTLGEATMGARIEWRNAMWRVSGELSIGPQLLNRGAMVF
jgi:hypothetical protein